MEHYTVGPCTLYHGDCMDVLPRLPEKADLLVSDPPYKLTQGGKCKGDDHVYGTGKTHKKMKGKFSAANYDNSGKLMEIVPWEKMAGPMFDACKSDADAYIMANDKNIFEARNAFVGSGWKFHNLLTWHKIYATPNRWYMKDAEYTLYLWKGKAKTIRNPGSKQVKSIHTPRGQEHSTTKPVLLMQYYIENSSEYGDLVLDPFAGSGSTLEAAMLSGRRAIGIEYNETYFDLACRKLDAAWKLMRETVYC